MSSKKKASGVLGLFAIPKPVKKKRKGWVLVLDSVRDPGNLGTIVRLCDWFGITQLVCSKDTVDCYNPKVLQATMGSIARVDIVYEDLERFLSHCEPPIMGTFMGAEPVYGTHLPEYGVLVMGNEANGISSKIEAMVTKKIGIPQFGDNLAESLNVATATAVLLSEIRRAGFIQK